MSAGWWGCVWRQSSRGSQPASWTFGFPQRPFPSCVRREETQSLWAQASRVFSSFRKSLDFGPFNINKKDSLWGLVSQPSVKWNHQPCLHTSVVRREEGMNAGPWSVLAGTWSQGQVGWAERAVSTGSATRHCSLWPQRSHRAYCNYEVNSLCACFLCENSDLTLAHMEEAMRTAPVFPNDWIWVHKVL